MTDNDRFNLVTKHIEEVLTPEELKLLLSSGQPITHYIGFEISGKLHLGQGLYVMQVIKDLQEAGIKTTIFLADWHTWLNNKLDGKLETAKRLAREYFQEGLIASAICVGADPKKINFVLGSELYQSLGLNYWANMIKVSKAITLSRMIRSTTIMGRKSTELSDSAMLIYPAMQSADIFALNANLAHAGTDQRNVHVIAREAASSLGQVKPIAIHHHLLQGLLKPAIWPIPKNDKLSMIEGLKMSKSKPDSAVFIHDSAEEIRKKLNNAFAPEGEVTFNPIIDWVKYLIFGSGETTFTVDRSEKWGGPLTYSSFEQLEKTYINKILHPQDLKVAVAGWLINKLIPAKEYFDQPNRKAALAEIEMLTLKR